MGCRAGLERAGLGALAVMFSRRSLAMLVLLFAVTSTLPLMRAAHAAPSLFNAREDPGQPPPPDEEEPNEGHDCHSEISCVLRPPQECLEFVCHHCSPLGAVIPSFCAELTPTETFFALVAQIALGIALFVAIAALLGVVYRTCTSDRRMRTRQRRPQIRTSAGSITSADVYFNERLQDCPPCYEEISWEKPPSYSNLPVLEESSTGQPTRQNASRSRSCASTPGEHRRAGMPSSPPPYGSVFTISQHVQHLRTPPATSDDDRGIVFVAVVHPEEAEKEESTDERPKTAVAGTSAATGAGASAPSS